MFYLNENDKIHASVFSHLFDQYLSKTNNIFSFSLRQSVYAELEVFIDGAPRGSTNNIKAFLEQEISSVAGVPVAVEVSVVAKRDSGQKRNYFVQNMKVSE